MDFSQKYVSDTLNTIAGLQMLAEFYAYAGIYDTAYTITNALILVALKNGGKGMMYALSGATMFNVTAKLELMVRGM